MKRIFWFASLLVITAAASAPRLAAQSFQGTGQEATPLFSLAAGLSVFEVEHSGAGAFAIRLLDEQGAPVEELARGTGAFRGSKAVAVPRAGRFLLDVQASGPWSVRRREDAAPVAVSVTDPAAALPDTASPVYRAAAEAARGVPTNRWLASGFVGGLLGGPIGAAIAVGIADGSRVTPFAGAGDGVPAGDPGFDAAFRSRVRDARKKKAFIGGMVGSVVFLGGLVYALQVAGGDGGGGTTPDPGGGEFVLVPR